jgi:hypothetical protein
MMTETAVQMKTRQKTSTCVPLFSLIWLFLLMLRGCARPDIAKTPNPIPLGHTLLAAQTGL